MGVPSLSGSWACTLLHQPLPHSVNEVGVGGGLSAGAHVAGNLATMVGRVNHHVGQDVDNGTGPRLALAVLVGNRLRDVARGNQIEKFEPLPTQFGRLRLTLFKV